MLSHHIMITFIYFILLNLTTFWKVPMSKFKLTYATMFNPPAELHTRFDESISKLKTNLGEEFGMFIAGKDVFADTKLDDYSPIDTDMKLAIMQIGDETHAQVAIEAARKAFPAYCVVPPT